jgi:hypothetical protein
MWNKQQSKKNMPFSIIAAELAVEFLFFPQSYLGSLQSIPKY